MIGDNAPSLNTRSQSAPATKGTAQQTFAGHHAQGITEYLQQKSGLSELTAVELYQRLLEIYGEELDQEITSDTILTDIKNLVQEQLDQNQLWQTVAQEIWSNLVFRAMQEVQQDLGAEFLESLDWEEFNQILERYLFNPSAFNLEERIHHLEEYYAHALALKIIQDLKLDDQPVSMLKRQFKIKSYIVSPADSTASSQLNQSGPITEIPSDFPILCRETDTGEISFSDQFQSDLWQSDTRGIAYLRYHSKHNRNNYLEHYITSVSEIETLPWEATEQILNKFGLNAAKLQLILAAHAAQQTTPWQNTFTLSASAIADALGWDNQTSKASTVCRSRIASLVYALSCLLIKVVWLENPFKQTRTIHTPVSKLWEVLISPEGDFDWTTGRIERSDEINFTIRPGLWVHNFVNQSEANAQTVLQQFGQVASTLLTLDAYHNDLVLHLVLYLMLNLRLRASDANPYEYEVGTLLKAALSVEVIQTAETDLEKGQQLFDQWTQALAVLEQLGWSAAKSNAYSAAAVTQGISLYAAPYPKWLDLAQNMRKPRGWVHNWLQQKLIIKPLGESSTL